MVPTKSRALELQPRRAGSNGHHDGDRPNGARPHQLALTKSRNWPKGSRAQNLIFYLIFIYF